jgi:anthranilate phosphoribosyltransferase
MDNLLTMRTLLEELFQHKTLSRQQAAAALCELASGRHSHAQLAAFLTAFLMRSLTLDELRGFRDGLLQLCQPVDLSDVDPIDVCGTGGDGKHTFNISTLTAFVLAGAGIPVAKHGNYGVSSVSGSSNVLEQLGVAFATGEGQLRQQLTAAGICFLHAPLFHPAMRQVAPVRRELGVKTFFNMLGPLVNPARPRVQLVGVYNLELARMYRYLFQEEATRYAIVYSLDGSDEVTLTTAAVLMDNSGEQRLGPEAFGFDPVQPADLQGGKSVAEAAAIFLRILEGRGSAAQNNIVLANAALGIRLYRPELSLADALEAARESLLGLKARQALSILQSLS